MSAKSMKSALFEEKKSHLYGIPYTHLSLVFLYSTFLPFPGLFMYVFLFFPFILSVKESMLDILFIYCKEKPDLGYRQGMHEILAAIVFVLHAEKREPDDITLA